MFKICSQTIGGRKKKCVHVAGVYGHVLHPSALAKTLCEWLWMLGSLSRQPQGVGSLPERGGARVGQGDVRVTEPSTQGVGSLPERGGARVGQGPCATFCMDHTRRAAPTSCFRPARPSCSCMGAFGTAVRIAPSAVMHGAGATRAPPSGRFTGRTADSPFKRCAASRHSRMDFRSIAGAPRCTILELAVIDHQG
jgi:hypothetical protein